VTILATLWDTETDAVEFEKDVHGTAGSVIRRRRDAVILIAGASTEQSGKLAEQALASLAPEPSSPPR